MYADADDLPPELIARIVQFLPAALRNVPRGHRRTKKGLGNCSLVCKYWAQFLRSGLFRELTFKTAEDGQQFYSFIERPVSPELSIKGLVRRVTIECDFAEKPWLHHVFKAWNPDASIRSSSSVNVHIFNSSNTSSDLSLIRPPSIYRSIPLPPSPSRTPINTLSLRNVTFADLSYLGKLFASIGPELREVTLEDIFIEDVDKLCVSSPFPQRVHTKMAVTVTGGNAPVQLLRSLLPVRHQSGDYTWFIRPHILRGLEQAILAIMWQTKGPASAKKDDSKPISYFVRLDFKRSEGYDILFEGRSSAWYPTIEAIDAVFSADGNLTRVSIMLGHSREHESFPWQQIDETLWKLIPSTRNLVISFFRVGRRYNIIKLTSQKMTNFMREDKLQFGYFSPSREWRDVLARDEIQETGAPNTDQDAEGERSETEDAEGRYGEGRHGETIITETIANKLSLMFPTV